MKIVLVVMLVRLSKFEDRGRRCERGPSCRQNAH